MKLNMCLLLSTSRKNKKIYNGNVNRNSNDIKIHLPLPNSSNYQVIVFSLAYYCLKLTFVG